MSEPPQRRTLHHAPPEWVKSGSLYFVTICTDPRGANQLCEPKIGAALIDSAQLYYEAGKWWLSRFLLMPDHLHALMAFPTHAEMATTIRVWKSYQARTLGIRWQSGFFDHRLRSDESEEAKAQYIAMNPVRAGLMARAEDWAFRWPRCNIEDGSSEATRPTCM